MLFTSNRDRQFFSLLRDAAQNLVESAQVFWDLSQATGRSDEYAARLKDLEKRGDRYTHDLITLLNKLFVTPLDREDILRLAVVLDDVVDGLEAAASRIFIYRIDEDNRYIREFASLIMGQTEEIVQAIEHLQAKDLLRIRENAVQINVLENQGDDLLREALANLLNNERDPARIIKLKEIFETLETVTDRAEDVANALESVVMKHA